jgi:hypothetical protein
LASKIKKRTQIDDVDELGAVDNIQRGNNISTKKSVKCEACSHHQMRRWGGHVAHMANMKNS